MTIKVSRVALVVGVAIGASGLVAIPAQAADTLYFANAPAVTGATAVTPESATLTGAVDTGGTPGTPFSVAAGATLSWVGGLNILNTTTTAETMWIDGLPTSGSSSNVVINGGTPSLINNDGNDDFSDVQFEYDTLANYIADGDSAGDSTQYASEVDVPTTVGISPVSVQIGAFGISAKTSSGNTPLKPGTKYVYWIIDQPGETDDAQLVNTFNPASPKASTTVNPNYVCYPNAYIAKNSYLSTLTPTGTVSGGITATGGPAQTAPQPDTEGPCEYVYGNVSGVDNYNSPTGEFSTPALGKLSVASSVAESSGKTTLSISDQSAYKASGKVELMSGKTKLATGKFRVRPNFTEKVTLSLTSAGRNDLARTKKTSAKVVLTSQWDQPTTTKSVKL
jgi:hypothetical protein